MTTPASADPTGARILYDARYLDIVADSRIVIVNAMNVDDRRIPVPLDAVGSHGDGDRTHLRMTELVAVFDGADQVAERDHGLREPLDPRTAVLADAPG